MRIYQLLEYYWFLNYSALILAFIIILLHWGLNGFRFTNKSVLFLDGIILFIFAACSPLDYLGNFYLFSAHMTEHIILLLIVPPLLLSGTEESSVKRILSVLFIRKLSTLIFHPVSAWIIGIGIMWVWHIPGLFYKMNHSHVVHIINVTSLITAGTIFMWPVFAPAGFRRLQPLQSAVYLFFACVGCTLLGIFITFAPDGLYTSYSYEVDPVLYNQIHSDWGITNSIDQQLGGLIMWVPACIVYLTNIIIIMIKWLYAGEKKESLV